MASKPRPIFIAEAIAVFGIFGLYALEFAGIHTFSQLLPMRGETTPLVLSFENVSGNLITINTGTVFVMASIALVVVIYFVFIRKRILRRKRK